MNYQELKVIEKRLNNMIEKSKRAWERANDGNQTQEQINRNEKLSQYWGEKLEFSVKEINPSVKIDWPGLYPTFQYNGMTIYTVSGLLNALFFITAYKIKR